MPLGPLLRDVDVVEMRQLRAGRLIHRAVVIAVVNVPAASGVGFTQQEQRVAGNVKCFMQPISASLNAAATGQDVAQSNYRVEFEPDAGIVSKHRLYITGRSAGISFEKRVGVMSVNVPRGQMVSLTAACTDNIDEAGSGEPPG